MRHYEITGAAAIHVPWFVGSVDPWLTASNHVAARKWWWDTSEERMKIRNAANTAWVYLGEDVGGI